MLSGQVMVVDADAALRESLAEILRDEGHGVVAAHNGRHALELLADAEPPSVIVLDLMMPVMDGWAVLWTLHDRPVHPPVIVMSARPENTAGHRPLGAIRYLQKPFRLEDVVSSVEEVLSART